MSTARADTGLPAPGDQIAQYTIVRELGRGGMGVVYMARDTRLQRRVAIKFLLNSEPYFVRRFMIEARAMARCAHENIGVIYAADEHRGHPYLVLEYHEGQTLRSWLKEQTLPLPPDQVIALLLPIARALECAHELGIVHRDLKPENIMMTEVGVLKVLDFGIAKLMAEAHWMTQPEQPTSTAITAETQDRRIIGSPPYMSPEQWGADEIDYRTDLWAVGIMAFEMAIG